MSNFVSAFKKGKEGRNFGLDTGIPPLNKAINKFRKSMSIGLAAAPKCGKTTFADYAFVIAPYLDAIKLGMVGTFDAEGKMIQAPKIEWIYYSYEISRVSKEFKYAAYFMHHDHKIWDFKYKGETYKMSGTYLMGQQLHDLGNGETELIPVSEEHEALLRIVYQQRIVPLFGEFDENGEQKQKGLITFIEEPENPTGIYNQLLAHAAKNGSYSTEKYTIFDSVTKKKVIKERPVNYRPKDPDKFTIVITDHIRKLRRERGFSMKDNIDKYLEYSTLLRNACEYSFIHIIHSNRNLANPDRLKYAGEWIFPTSDDCKDSGNPAEECTIFMTLFNPNDEKYNLKKHFGVELAGYPNYRSLHITEARDVDSPAHIQMNMFGNINLFTPLNI